MLMDCPSASSPRSTISCASTSSGRASVVVLPFTVITKYGGFVKKSSAAVGTPSIHHSTFAGFTTTVFVLPFSFTFFVTAALYLSCNPAGSPFATTLYAVFPSVGTS